MLRMAFHKGVKEFFILGWRRRNLQQQLLLKGKRQSILTGSA